MTEVVALIAVVLALIGGWYSIGSLVVGASRGLVQLVTGRRTRPEGADDAR